MEPLEADDPRTIGDYRLLRRLGSGGMGRVYLGRSPRGRTVAVKVVHAYFANDRQFRTRFRLEIEAGRRVGGQWTAPVLDADPDAPTPWVATGYVAGPSLYQAVEAHGPLPEPTVRALGAGLAEALAAVHRLDLVHRDVKPSNVLLTLDGPRLIDFGIARATDATAALTATGVSIGSPGFMSPEQVLGRPVAPSTDVFSMGAVLVQAATGTPPFPGESSASLLYKVVHEEPELGGLQGGLRELAAVCLAKDAADRPTAAEVAERLAGGAGAATLIVPGWLPGPVVEGVSRRAVELLELESEPAAPDGPAAAPGGPATVPVGPPPPSSGGPSTPPPPPGPHTPPPGFGPAPGPYPYGTPPPQNQPPHRSPHPPQDAGAGRRRTLVRALAAVVLVVALGAGGYLVANRGSGNDSPQADSGGQHAGSSAGDSGGESSGTPGGDGSDGKADGGKSDGGRAEGATSGSAGVLTVIPHGFVGTWTGTVTNSAGNSNELEITIDEGQLGDTAVAAEATRDHLECKSDSTVTSIADDKLQIVEQPDSGNPPGCTPVPVQATLTLLDNGKLRYRSDNLLGANPTGDLTMERD